MDIVESTSAGSPGVLTLTLNGRLDADGTDTFAGRLAICIDRGERRIVLDLAAVDYVSSVGLRSLVLGAKRLAPLGGRLVLCQPQARIRQLLDIAGFTSMFPIAASRDEAAERMA
ncbi:MAG TPA: STAS domain-containing protein [Vicinamibacterales bacterium]